MRKLDTRFGGSTLWQFIKFNLVSFSITLLQLALANLLPLIFDGVAAKLPPVLRPIFQPETLFAGSSPYVVDGIVTWVDTVCFAGFTEEEIRLYHKLEERIGNCILHHLQAETAIES